MGVFHGFFGIHEDCMSSTSFTEIPSQIPLFLSIHITVVILLQLLIGCHNEGTSSTNEVVDDFGNRIYLHNVTYDFSQYDDAEAASGKAMISV